MDWLAAKNKKTGEVVSVLATIWGSEKTTITYSGKDGIKKEMEARKFERNFEQVELDLSSIIPVILEGAKVSYEVRSILCPLARKCMPDYYRVGDVVYITNVDENAVSLFGRYIHLAYGLREMMMFKIVKIDDSFSRYYADEGGTRYLLLQQYCPGDKKEPKPGDYDISAPIQDKKPFAFDAARYLKRFDMPF